MIKLLAGFCIKVEADQYILIRQKEGKTKTGDPKITETVHGYYGPIEKCLMNCRKVLFSEHLTYKVVTLSEAIQIIKDLNEELKNLIPEEVK